MPTHPTRRSTLIKIVIATTLLALWPADGVAIAQTGACCNGSVCTLRTFSTCTGNGGVFLGGSCSAGRCDNTMVPCCGNGDCVVVSAALCSSAGGQVLAGTCSPNPCPGRCCTIGSCTITTQALCSGNWFRGSSCSPNICPPGGRCCVDTSCTTTVQTACTGTWQQDAPCSPNPCVGACCNITTGACSITSPTGCPLTGGAYRGDGTVCDTVNTCQGTLLAIFKQTGPEAGIPKPENVVIVDVLVDVGADDTWTAAGIHGMALNGAQLIYGSFTDADDNLISPALVSPGSDDRYKTVLSTPRDVAASSRFNAGAVAIAGRYCPSGPIATNTAQELNLSFFASPPATSTSPSVDGGIVRIALDISGVAAPHNLDTAAIFVGIGAPPADVTPLFVSACAFTPGGPGTLTASFDHPQAVGIDWFVGFVPGPSVCCSPSTGGCTINTAQASCPTGSVPFTGTTCDPNPCPQPLACCNLATGACTIGTAPTSCPPGSTPSTGTTCSPSPCVGACCVGSACTLIDSAGCSGVGTFHGTGTPCGTDAVNPTTCCPANFNGMGGLSVQDIFDFLAAFFAGEFNADFNHSMTITVQDIFDFLAAYFVGCS